MIVNVFVPLKLRDIARRASECPFTGLLFEHYHLNAPSVALECQQFSSSVPVRGLQPVLILARAPATRTAVR